MDIRINVELISIHPKEEHFIIKEKAEPKAQLKCVKDILCVNKSSMCGSELRPTEIRSSTKVGFYCDKSVHPQDFVRSPTDFKNPDLSKLNINKTSQTPAPNSTNYKKFVGGNKKIENNKKQNENLCKSRPRSSIKVEKSETSSVFSPFSLNKNLMNYTDGEFNSNATSYKVSKHINYAVEPVDNSNSINNSRCSAKVININLERIRDELENTNKADSRLNFCFTNSETMNNLLSVNPENNIMNQLTPQQQEEIMRIRQEGTDRCNLILDKIGVIKNKTEDVISTSQERSSMLKQNEQLLNMMEAIKHTEVDKKFERCESRMNNFEQTITEILSFTKKTCKEIQGLQKSLNNMNVINSRGNLSIFDNSKSQINNAFSDTEIEDSNANKNLNNTNDYKEQLRFKKPKELDDTVNYKSKESFHFGNNYHISKYCGKAKLNNKSNANLSIGHRSSNIKTPVNCTSINSVGINDSMGEVESSPTLQMNIKKEKIEESSKIIKNYNTCDANNKYTRILSNQKSNNLQDAYNIGNSFDYIHNDESLNPQVLDSEERKICAMEIELLKKKLNYYSNQLISENIKIMTPEEKSKTLVEIKSIQKQLVKKISELDSK